MSAKGTASGSRLVRLAAVVLGIAGAGLVVSQILLNPVDAMRETFAENRQMGAVPVEESPTLPDPGASTVATADFAQQIAGKAGLWASFVEPPKPPEEPPPWDKILQGVQLTGSSIGSGPTMKVKIRTSGNDAAGRWVSVGEVINGATIKEVTKSAILFVIRKGGKEYTYTLQ